MLFLAKIICEFTVYYLILGIIYIIRVLFILFNVDTELNNTFHLLFNLILEYKNIISYKINLVSLFYYSFYSNDLF